jgi:hypothetical protein
VERVCSLGQQSSIVGPAGARQYFKSTITDCGHSKRLQRLLDSRCDRNRNHAQRTDLQVICPTGKPAGFKQHDSHEEPCYNQGNLPD